MQTVIFGVNATLLLKSRCQRKTGQNQKKKRTSAKVLHTNTILNSLGRLKHKYRRDNSLDLLVLEILPKLSTRRLDAIFSRKFGQFSKGGDNLINN